MLKTITIQSAYVTPPQTSKAGKQYQNQVITDQEGETYNLFYNPKFDKTYTQGQVLELRGEQNGQYINWNVLTKSDKQEMRIEALEARVSTLEGNQLHAATGGVMGQARPAPRAQAASVGSTSEPPYSDDEFQPSNAY